MTARETADGLMDRVTIAIGEATDDASLLKLMLAHRDAIEAALVAERKAALAEAAEVATVHGKTARLTGDHNTGYVTACKRIAAAILALSPEGKGPTDHTPEEET